MDQIKGLTNSIDQATSDMQQGPSGELYGQVQKWVLSRADMPKHCITHISKRLMIKNDKVTFLTIDLIQYLMYVTELPFWSQICTKEFLMKISQILQSKDQASPVSQRILEFVKAEYEVYKPHQDLLPTFFQFYEGLVKKGYDQKGSYVSPYRPKELKKYATKVETKPKPPPPSTSIVGSSSQRPSLRNQPQQPQQKTQKYTVDGIRQRIVLTNEIIDECNPAEQVKNNNLLIEMMTSLKQIQKSLNGMISQGSDQKTMEQAIALNDDLLITFRRFKDLQKNRKPEPFLITELASSYIVREQPKPKKQTKSIFDQFDINQQPKPQRPSVSKQSNASIFDFDDPKPAVQGKKESFNIFEVDEPSPVNHNTTSIPIQMNTISSVQMNMNTMSVPMHNVPNNFNSSLLGLNFGPTAQSPPQQNPTTFSPQKSQLLGGVSFTTNSNPVPSKNQGFNFGNISAPSNLHFGGISMNSGSGLIFNNQFATEAVNPGQYTEKDLTDLTDMFSKKF